LQDYAKISNRGFDSAKAGAALRAQRPLRHKRLTEAAEALANGLPGTAQHVLAKFLDAHPADVCALHLMAEAALRLQQTDDAESLLVQCVGLAPGFDLARFDYARLLHQQDTPHLAAVQLDTLLAKDPQNLLYRELAASVLAALGKHAEAAQRYGSLAQDYPQSAEFEVHHGISLRAVGRTDDCAAAYRRAITLSPARGDAYWALANLPAFRFGDGDIAQMLAQLARPELASDTRAYFHSALGAAYGTRESWADSFDHFAKANAIRRIGIAYDPDSTTARVAKLATLFTRAFFQSRIGSGCRSAAPIFVVGMQRAGSTLVEQMLASHSAVEGAGELPDLPVLARAVETRIDGEGGASPEAAVAQLDAEALKDLGERYVERTRARTCHGRPFFIDKQPYNFWRIGLIQLILPEAKIVDVRRHPLACCFSNFTKIARHPLPFLHRQSDLGRYYADYVKLMAHFDHVLPGTVHRVIYERLVTDTEAELRRLLAYLDLPFERACLEFHANGRAFDSASNEQVRMPIFREGLEQWRPYEPWLAPLKAALGRVIETYPGTPYLAA
jgi:tetratricopeptide (TPR) repeat protein